MADLSALQTRLGWSFRSTSLLELALTHPSVAQGQEDNLLHNQRLEFLGDAVLSLILSWELHERFPTSGEGSLTKARAHLANRRTLAEQARRLDLGSCLILSRGEEASGGRSKPSVLADVFEAVVGAVFIDGGLEPATRLVLRCYEDFWSGVPAIPKIENPKGELQEWLQARNPEAPIYQVVAVSGPDHDRLYECAVQHAGAELGRGRGKSKQSAESQAAAAALARLRQQAPESSPAASRHNPPVHAL